MEENKNGKKADGVQASFFTWEYDIPKKENQTVKENQKESVEEKPETSVSDEGLESATSDPYFSREIINTENNESNEQLPVADQYQNKNGETVEKSYCEPNSTLNDSSSSTVIPEINYGVNNGIEEGISTKRYTKASDFSRLAIVFGDRKLQYYLYLALFFAASVSAATLMFKFEESGIGTAKKMALDYFSFGTTLKSDLWNSMLFASPFIAGSLIVYFGGYTIFAKFISSVWMAGTGFLWSLFSVSAYPKFEVGTFVIFGVLSAFMMLNNIVFSAEAGKYSALNLYGKAELTKFENVRQFSVVYIGYCIFTCVISYFVLKFVI